MILSFKKKHTKKDLHRKHIELLLNAIHHREYSNPSM